MMLPNSRYQYPSLQTCRTGGRGSCRAMSLWLGRSLALPKLQAINYLKVRSSPWDTLTRWSKAIQLAIPIALIWVIILSGCKPPPSSNSTTSAKGQKVELAKPPVLITVSISPESRVKAATEDISTELVQGTWQDFSIEIENAAGITAPLIVESEQISKETMTHHEIGGCR